MTLYTHKELETEGFQVRTSDYFELRMFCSFDASKYEYGDFASCENGVLTKLTVGIRLGQLKSA